MQKIDRETEKKFLEAEKLRINGNFQKAINILEKLIEDNPDFLPAINNIALNYIELKNFDEAEKYYKMCLNTEPVSILSINNLAKLYYNMGQFNKALPILRKSLLIKDDQESVIELTAQCLFELSLTKQTDTFCSEALKKFPQNKYLKTFYGKNLLRLNRHSEGLKYLNESSGMIEFGEKDFKIV